MIFNYHFMRNYLLSLIILTSLSCSNQNDSHWHKIPVVDQFGDKVTGEFNIGAQFNGTFSNSAVKDGELIIEIQEADSSIFIGFHEYGQNAITTLPENVFVIPMVKTAGGKILQTKNFLFRNYMGDGEGKEIFELLMKETKPFKIVVDMSTSYTYKKAIYTFEIDPHGFKEMLINKKIDE